MWSFLIVGYEIIEGGLLNFLTRKSILDVLISYSIDPLELIGSLATVYRERRKREAYRNMKL